jgi:hypothetical protein
MTIDWNALLEVALVSFAFGVGIVTLFSVGILGYARVAREDSAHAAVDQVTFGEPSQGSRGAVLAGSAACFAACAAAGLYGLYLIIPQFH